MTIDINMLDIALSYGACVEYIENETIHSRGDMRVGLSIVYSGQVRVGNYGLDGQYQLTAILEKGDTFGEFTLFANLPRTHNAEAVGIARVIQMNHKQYNAFVSTYPAAEKMLLGSLAKKLHQALELLDDARRLPSYTRLAKHLFGLCKQQQTQSLNIKQQQCAQVLGVTVLSAHKALKKLQQESLIQTAYGRIYINDIDALEQWLQQQSSILPVATNTK